MAHTPSLVGESFLLLRNLGLPDGLIPFGGRTFNIMPIIMTAVNIASAFIYTKGLGKREKIQLFGISFIFLILLYNSPSGLVLYWTCNNVFSLGKNIACAKLKAPGKALQLVISVFALLLIIGSLSGAFDIDRYVFLFTGLGLALLAAPFVWKGLIHIVSAHPLPAADCVKLYFSALALLCLIMGVLIPAQVIAASVVDFNAPFQFIIQTFLQSLAFFILLPLLIWLFASQSVRTILSFTFSILVILSLICLFALSASYGAMTNSFKIEDTQAIVNAFPFWANIVAVLIACSISGVFIFFHLQKIVSSLFNATAIAVLVLTIININSILSESKQLSELREAAGSRDISQVVFPLTRTGTNNFVVFLDRATGIALYTALEQMPGLAEKLDGFTWYPNTMSFGECTIVGLPAMMGGYDYSPDNINARDMVNLKDKVNEALTMLPRIFGEAGYRVSITDPSMTNLQLVPDLTVFSGMKNVSAQNLDGRFDRRFMEEFPHEAERLIDSFDFDILFRYGLFRIALPALRYGIHYKGSWWRDGASNAYGRGLTEYASLYYLSDVCAADTGVDTLNIFMNETTHIPGAYTAELIPVPGPIRYSPEEITLFGSEDNTSYMYTFMAAMKALGRWIDSLKEMGVYDNTRIVIVADHGDGYSTDIFKYTNMTSYNPLLIVKQPGVHGTLAISGEFMTNADMSTIVTADMENPVNPYLGTPIGSSPKEGPLTVVNAVSFQPRRHGPIFLNLSGKRKLVAPNIFSADSWEPWQKVKQ
ncbi:hypothetical protein [Treponema primitia]|uniref:hypothetical protein n=1 Tax=Treponema primitia TaxID=88058 RepID=UPI001E33CAD7|nr:hypothetical protein [Treponema primitia]